MHFEALTETGRRLFPRLSKFDGFYLAGGTALALQIGHRLSVDFDMFSNEAAPPTLLEKVKRVFAGEEIIVLVNNQAELTLTVSGVKVTFLHYPFPVIKPLLAVNGLSLMSPAEVAATKAYTVGRRGEYKDYVDIYFSLHDHHTNLRQVLDLASQKYGQEFNDRLFLEQLAFMDDLVENSIQFLGPLVTKAEISSFLATEIQCLRL